MASPGWQKTGWSEAQFCIVITKPNVMANPDEKKVDKEDDELAENLKTEYPLSGGETDKDLEDALNSIMGIDNDEDKGLR